MNRIILIGKGFDIYHQKEDESDNFQDIVTNIARNFNNKARLREIVLDKSLCSPLFPLITQNQQNNINRKNNKICTTNL